MSYGILVMKYLKIFLFVCALAISGVANAETYYVNTEVLNLRSCEGTDCKILGKLTSGEAVELLEDKGEWVKVETDKGAGFVIKRSLTTYSSDTATGEVVFNMVVLLIIVWIALFFYLLPSRIAANNKNANKIYRVNLFLGWIPIIWLILFVAALIGESKEET